MNEPFALADRIDALLPQTQCRRCGFAACLPYAEAIARGEAAIDRCPPGGEATLAALAALLGVPPLPLDRSRGAPGPLRIAAIDEDRCIGCTLCIAACPVDAIIGAQKRMHAVFSSLCSGCELCLPACPIDCIEMRPAQRAWTAVDADAARRRHAQRAARGAATKAQSAADAHAATRRAAIEAAFARARARRAVEDTCEPSYPSSGATLS